MRLVLACLATRPRYLACVIGWSVLASLSLALLRGQDTNWDQLNYHLSMPHLLLHGQFWASVAPSGIQSWLNPAVLVGQYALISHLPPFLAAAAIALGQSAAFVLAGLICAEIAPAQPRYLYLPAFLGFLLCLASPMALSEVGTTYIDLLTAVPVLLAWWLLLTRRAPGWAWAAGLLLGLAAGLKLTNAIYVLGATGFLLAGAAWRQRLADGLRLGAGVGLGFLAAAGVWHALVFRRFGNPFFPYYNAIFRAPDHPAVDLSDTRFGARAVWDAVRFPRDWLLGGSPAPGLLSPSSEVTLHDARFALVGVLCLLLLRWRPARAQAGFLLACLLVYLVWLYGFGVHRYIVGLELLLGAALLSLSLLLPTPRLRIGLLGLLCLLTASRFHIPDWRHAPWRAQWQGIAQPALLLDGPALVFIRGKPFAHAVTGLCCDVRMVGVSEDFDLRASAATSLARQIAETVPRMRTLWLASDGLADPALSSLLDSHGLRPSGRCLKLPLVRGPPGFSLCELERSPA